MSNIFEVAGTIDLKESIGADRILLMLFHCWETSRMIFVLRLFVDAGVRTILAENISSGAGSLVLESLDIGWPSSTICFLKQTSILAAVVCWENDPLWRI